MPEITGLFRFTKEIPLLFLSYIVTSSSSFAPTMPVAITLFTINFLLFSSTIILPSFLEPKPIPTPITLNQKLIKIGLKRVVYNLL